MATIINPIVLFKYFSLMSQRNAYAVIFYRYTRIFSIIPYLNSYVNTISGILDCILEKIPYCIRKVYFVCVNFNLISEIYFKKDICSFTIFNLIINYLGY